MKPQYGNRNSPKLDFRGSDVWGKLGVAVDGSVFDTDGYPNRRDQSASAGAVDRQQRRRAISGTSREARLQPDRPGAGVRPRPAISAKNGDNGKISTLRSADRGSQRHDVEVRQRRRAHPAAGLERSPGDASSPTSRRSTATSWRCPTATPAAQHRPHDAQSDGADQGRRRHGAVVAGVRRHARLTAGTDWRWVDGDSEEDGLDATTGDAGTLHRVSGGTQRSAGRLRAGLFTPHRRTHRHAERARSIAGATTTRTTSRRTCRPAPPTRSVRLPDKDDTVVSPRARRAVSRARIA